ncbi:MAG: outer membrane protein assembly factor [Fibrobacter sp.]|nr:outer membrane protein assembly factor [Fibrobacter sp.]
MFLGISRKFFWTAFLMLLMAFVAVEPVVAAEDSTEMPSDETASSKEDSFQLSSLWLWPFNNVIQPVLNGLVYPVAKPVDYAFKNGVIEKSVDLITFGENRNILIYPSLNLKPGSNTMVGVNYRHRSLFLGKDYLVLQANYYANGDASFDARYTKHALFGSPLFGGIKTGLVWNRDDHFIIPETKSAFLQPDSSYYVTFRLGAPLTKSLNWNVDAWTTLQFQRASVPDVQDSILIDTDFPIEERGLYQNHNEIPVGLSISYDDLDFPFAPSRGSRIAISGSYTFVDDYRGVKFQDLGIEPDDRKKLKLEDSGLRHDYLRTEFLFQHYFFLGKSEQFILSATEARQNRRFYTDFSWDQAVRVWRPENVMQTLFERRVLALQYRMLNLWEMENGGAPFNAFPWLNARTPLRGYGDVWSAHHMMSLSCEYRWPVDRFVDGVLFDEYAMIAPKIDKWDFDHFYNSWGFGIRVRQPNMYLFRVQFGFHGLHGVNLVMTIAPEFK